MSDIYFIFCDWDRDFWYVSKIICEYNVVCGLYFF